MSNAEHEVLLKPPLSYNPGSEGATTSSHAEGTTAFIAPTDTTVPRSAIYTDRQPWLDPLSKTVTTDASDEDFSPDHNVVEEKKATNRMASSAMPTEGFSPIVAICFTVNYIMGTGFLALPWAFVEGGLVSSIAIMFLIGVVSDVSKDFILEGMARAEARSVTPKALRRKLKKDFTLSPLFPEFNLSSSSVRSGSATDLKGAYSPRVLIAPKSGGGGQRMVGLGAYGAISSTTTNPNGVSVYGTPRIMNYDPHYHRVENGMASPKLQRRPYQNHVASATNASTNETGTVADSKWVVADRKYEVNELCRIFLGEQVTRIYTSFISFYLYLALWAYTSVFAGAFAKEAPVFEDNVDGDYFFYVACFAVLVVPLSCLEMREQVTIQVILATARVLMVLLMVCTLNQKDASEEPHDPAPLVRPRGFYHTLPILAYAFIYHHSIPGLSHPVGDKRRLGCIFRSTFVLSGTLYTCVGVIVGMYFGTSISQSSNLNWKDYRGGTGRLTEDGTWVDVAWWARLISIFVVCFPALDVASAFPLNAITLGNNLLGWKFSGKNKEKGEKWRVPFRLIASIPPIFGACFVRELGVITDYAGAMGFLIAFSFPSFIYLASSKDSKPSYYTSYGTTRYSAILVCIFGFGMAIFVLYQLSV